MIDPVTGAALIGLGGSFLGGLFGHSAQKKANKTNIRLQQEQLAWQERMSNTAWQRGKQDMLAAGFNPMLAFSQGPASTPNVSAAQVQPEDAFARGVSSAADKAMQVLQLKNMELQNRILSEKGQQEIVHTANLQGKYPAGEQPGGLLEVEIQRARDEANKVRSEADRARTDANIRKIEEIILRETADTNVQSAKARAQILEREITGADLKNQLMALDIPERQAIAKWFETVGAGSPAMKAVMSISQWLRMILGR